jgi:acyl-coenzyme A thioesterase PaaI-like protein
MSVTAERIKKLPCLKEIPELAGEAGWTPFDAPALVGDSLRFVSGDPTGKRFRVRYYRDSQGALVARVWFGPETEGPPGHAHGGSIAAVLDEVLGLAAWAAGYAIVVGKLNIHFQKLLPLRTVVQVDSRIVSVEGRKVLVRGRIHGPDELTFAEADCLCITLPGR